LRWTHLIVAYCLDWSFFLLCLAGQSFTFASKVYQLKELGVSGRIWAVYGGGFYNPQKYAIAPKTIPHQLHWFYWEAYSTWLSGFALFSVAYLSKC
jgi:uncharacterized membrane protein